MFKKRLMAYIIDIVILNLILSVVGAFFPVNESLNNLSNQLINLSQEFSLGDMSLFVFLNRYSVINYLIAKEVFISNLVGFFISICYFVVYPLYNDGASIGKKMMKLKVVCTDGSTVSSNKLLLRYFFINSIGVSLLNLCLIFFVKDIYYMYFVLFLDFLQFIVVIVSIFMVLYRNDFRSLPDLIAGTKVIEVKE